MLTHVLLAGGSGTRLWPLSRKNFPKQFLRLNGPLSLLEETVLRLRGIEADHNWLAVGGEAHRFLICEHLAAQGVTRASVILEPVQRSTAPAIALAALRVFAERGPDAVMLVTPADQLIRDAEAFRSAARLAAGIAATGKIVCFGVRPDRPETGYGYIQTGALRTDTSYSIKRFVEKPPKAMAERYLAAGHFAWNAGIFVFSAGTILEELRHHAPMVVDACESALEKSIADGPFLRINANAFDSCPTVSIDHAVLEYTDRAVVLPLDCGWSDIGSYDAIAALRAHDAQGNVIEGDGVLHDCRQTIVNAHSRLVAAIGLDDTIIVETDDAVLVSRTDRAQDVTELVQNLSAHKRIEAHQHPLVLRPWGSYQGVDNGPRHQVKRIVVKPGGKLSLQVHHHRAEHWVVVKGTAKVTCGENVQTLTEDQSTYIPRGTPHRLENPGQVPLEVIEVQTGGYLSEDDIVRIQDDYGRS